MFATENETMADVLAYARACFAHADATIAALPLDARMGGGGLGSVRRAAPRHRRGRPGLTAGPDGQRQPRGVSGASRPWKIIVTRASASASGEIGPPGRYHSTSEFTVP